MAAHQQEAQTLAVSTDLEAQPLDEPTSQRTTSGTRSDSSETQRELNHLPQDGNIDPEKAVSDEPAVLEEKTDLVDWDGPDDHSNPMNWTSLHKWIIISLVSAITFNVFVADTPCLAVPRADGWIQCDGIYHICTRGARRHARLPFYRLRLVVTASINLCRRTCDRTIASVSTQRAIRTCSRNAHCEFRLPHCNHFMCCQRELADAHCVPTYHGPCLLYPVDSGGWICS